MNDFFRFTKYKLVLSYLIFFGISIAATYFIYQKTESLASPSTEETQIRQKARLVNEILLNLFRIEEMSRSSIINTKSNSEELKSIESLIGGTNAYLDSLMTMTVKEHQHERLESIKDLLLQKQNNIVTLVSYIRTVKTDSIYRKSMNSILEVTQDNKEQINHVQREVVKLDTVKVAPKKKKFFQRVADVFYPSREDSSTRIVSSMQLKTDTLISGEVNAKDTVQKAFTKLIRDIHNEQEVARKEVLMRERKLAQSNQELTSSINQLLFDFEEEEIQNTLMQVEASHIVLKEIIRIAIFMMIIAFIVGLISLVFIVRDIAKSQRYRRELESEKALTEKLLRSREQLILSITHDIKSPLNSILGYLQIMHEGGASETEMVHNMMSSANHILDLVNSLLDYNRLEKGIIEKKEEEFNARSLFQDIFLSFEPAARNKELGFDLKMDEAIDSYCGDDFRIRQIVNNLLSNAIKYTNAGAVSLSVCWEKEEGEKGNLILRVSDTGRGLTASEKEQILKEFCRLSDHKNIEGLGLGLSITQKLIALLGGSLRIDSMIDKGTDFIVTLPLHQVETVKDEKLFKAISGNLRPTNRVQILVVDDDSIQLNMVKMLLEKNGYRVTTTLHPDQVIPLLQDSHFDVLITDIQMRDISGIDLVRNVRKLYPKKEEDSLPIIALSGISFMKESELIELGFDAMISKPVSSEVLLGKIRSILPSDASHYDLSSLTSFASGDADLEKELIDTFISESVLNLTEFRTAWEKGDSSTFRGLAHKMKSSFKMIQAEEIATILLDIENERYAPEELVGKVDEVVARITQLIEEISRK
ncbi:MAG: ATP-binding response regulator [Bacteroidales bacterium]